MITFLVVLHRRADLTVEQFVDYLERVHAPMAEALPGLVGYVHFLPAFDPTRPRPLWDAVIELDWESVALMEQAWRSPEGETATKDLIHFVDLEKTSWSIVDRNVLR